MDKLLFWVVSFFISLFVSAIMGLGPVAAVMFSGSVGLRIAVMIVAFVIVVIATGGVEKTSNEYMYVLCQQTTKMGMPGIVASGLLWLAEWMERWNEVDNFFGGVGIFFLATFALLGCASVVIMAFKMLITFNLINIVNAIVYAYLGVVVGVGLFSSSMEVCTWATILALVAAVPSAFSTGSKDPYPLDVNGHRAKQTGENEYTTQSGDHYKEVDDGWGRDYKKM